MKRLIFLIFLFALNNAHASQKKLRICVFKHQSEVTRTATEYADNYRLKDKFLHCSVSCMLKLRCGPIQAGLAGIVKELGDLFDRERGNSFGSGDLRADFKGLRIGQYAQTDDICLSKCQESYP